MKVIHKIVFLLLLSNAFGFQVSAKDQKGHNFTISDYFDGEVKTSIGGDNGPSYVYKHDYYFIWIANNGIGGWMAYDGSQITVVRDAEAKKFLMDPYVGQEHLGTSITWENWKFQLCYNKANQIYAQRYKRNDPACDFVIWKGPEVRTWVLKAKYEGNRWLHCCPWSMQNGFSSKSSDFVMYCAKGAGKCKKP